MLLEIRIMSQLLFLSLNNKLYISLTFSIIQKAKHLKIQTLQFNTFFYSSRMIGKNSCSKNVLY